MAKEQFRNQWPQVDDRSIVNAMLSDNTSAHWGECCTYIQYYIGMKRQDLSFDVQQDIAQQTMISVMNSLSDFRFECKLTTWLQHIADSRMIDYWRKTTPAQPEPPKENASKASPSKKPGQFPPLSLDHLKESAPEASTFNSPDNIEEQYISQEELHEVMTDAIEFLKDRSKFDRDWKIWQMHLAGYNFQEIAKRRGLSAPTVAKVVHSILEYLNKKWQA